MEVHHHSHTSRKKWTHYFWEFLMLFLAVFCGFLAENKREHIVEAHRAKEYAKSLLNDLKEDTAELQSGISHLNFLISAIDSLVSINSNEPDKSNVPGKFYYYSRLTSFYYPIDWNSSTLNQLVQSGNLRYFRNKELVNQINKYYALQNNIFGQGENDGVLREKLREIRNQILDDKYYSVFATIVFSEQVKGLINPASIDSLMKRHLPLQEGAVKYLPQFLNHLSDRRERLKSYTEKVYPNAKARAQEIIKVLIDEYHLK
jgi:hypothetical protein